MRFVGRDRRPSLTAASPRAARPWVPSSTSDAGRSAKKPSRWSRVASSACGTTRTSASTGMKLVSPRPARDDVDVQVLGDPGARRGAKVDPDVHALALERGAQAGRRLAHEAEEGLVIGWLERVERGDVRVRDDEEVARRERVAVEHDERAAGRRHDQPVALFLLGCAGMPQKMQSAWPFGARM